METTQQTVTVETTVKVPVEKVWEVWSNPRHIEKWNAASADWHTPSAENDLRPGGKFVLRMEAKDGSFGFSFEGVYDEVRDNEYIEYTLEDGRKVKISFTSNGDETKIVETFDAESTHTVELQQMGWQAILDSFKNYTETNFK